MLTYYYVWIYWILLEYISKYFRRFENCQKNLEIFVNVQQFKNIQNYYQIIKNIQELKNVSKYYEIFKNVKCYIEFCNLYIEIFEIRYCSKIMYNTFTYLFIIFAYDKLEEPSKEIIVIT